MRSVRDFERSMGAALCGLLVWGCDSELGPDVGDATLGDGSVVVVPSPEAGGGARPDASPPQIPPGEPGDGDGDAGTPPLCTQSCDDGVDCTADECVAAGVCNHALDPALCTDGKSCHPQSGCTQGKACSTQEDCADDDGCTVRERCSPELASCQFDPLDRDGDGQAPSICGGGDCNDADPDVNSGEIERCNGEDDDCDGNVDDAAACPVEGQVCTEGTCQCDAALTQCGFACADLQGDPRNCGACGMDCGPAGTCTAGACTCTAPGQICAGTCVNTSTSVQHCGACGSPCTGMMPMACVDGACAACGGEGEACCPTFRGPGVPPGDGCNGALTCSGTPGTPGAVCGCAAPNTKCGEQCVNLATSVSNCGACENACEANEGCLDVGNGPECTVCGQPGLPCCQFNGFGVCFGAGGGPGAACNPQTGMCPGGPPFAPGG